MALWSLLGPRPVQLLAFESFGKDWVTDVVKQLKIEAEVAWTRPTSALPDLSKVRPDADSWSSPGTRTSLGRPRAERRLHRPRTARA